MRILDSSAIFYWILDVITPLNVILHGIAILDDRLEAFAIYINDRAIINGSIISKCSHLPPITKTIQARRTRHAEHSWRSKDELVSDVLLWTPAYGQSKAGRPARTDIQQLCDDKGCNPEDLPEAMNNRETWRERVRNIRASSTTWWWCSTIKDCIVLCVYLILLLY